MCFAPQRRSLFRHLNLQKWSEPLVFLTFWLRNVLRATTACTFSTPELPKVVRTWCVLYILTWKRRALFRHLNFQKCSEHQVFCTFWLGNVLRATTACTFSSLIWPAGSAPAALASPQIIGKTQWIAAFLPFRASPSSFFLLFLFYSSLFWSFSSLCLCPTLLFICPYCRKFDFQTSFDKKWTCRVIRSFRVVFFHKARHFVGLVQYLAKDFERVSSRILPPLCAKVQLIAFQETLARLFHKSFCQSPYRSLMAMPCKSVSEECRSTVLLNIASETCATEVSYKGVFPACSSRVSCSLQESHTRVIRISVCVCVEHLNRCKTSNLVVSSYLYLYIGFISYTHVHLRPRFHLLGRLVRFRFWGFSSLYIYIYILLYIQCRGHATIMQTHANEAMHDGGSRGWSPWCTCTVVITCCSGFASIQLSTFADGKRLNPRTSRSFLKSKTLYGFRNLNELHQNLAAWILR